MKYKILIIVAVLICVCAGLFVYNNNGSTQASVSLSNIHKLGNENVICDTMATPTCTKYSCVTGDVVYKDEYEGMPPPGWIPTPFCSDGSAIISIVTKNGAALP
jgi:hypothetical protein